MQASWVLQLDERRHAVSMLATAVAAAALWAMAHAKLPRPPEATPQRLMTLVLEAVPAALQAPPPAPAPAPTPPVPPRQLPPPAVPAPAAQPTPAVTQPAPVAAAAAPSAVSAINPLSTAASSDAPARAAAAAPAPAPAAPPAAAPAHRVIEATYVSQLRALLDATKRYPTGREASQRRPQGKVVVWFVLNRAGVVQDAGIEHASDSHLLDQAAVSTVRRASFPPMPQAAWPAAGTHRFTATLDFVTPG